jgi:uncharacterized protein
VRSSGRVAIERFVPFTNRFGETIAVDLYLPAGEDGTPLTDRGCRYPVVLESSPYRDWITPQPTRTGQDEENQRAWWVMRGYVFAFADVPGTGGSDGEWCFLCRHEQLSGVDMVEALGRQPWSNGRVGLFGGSYRAITAMLIAQQRPKYLKAVLAASFYVDPYTDFFFPGGMQRGEDTTALMAAFTGLSRWTGQYAVPTSEDEASRFVEVWTARETSPVPGFMSIQDDHPTRDAWYADRTIHPQRITVPIYVLGGWNDIFDRATWNAYEHLGSTVKVLLQGPFTHVPLFMPTGAWPCNSMAIDYCGAPFFDKQLKGLGSKVYDQMLAAPVRSYVQPSGDSAKAAYIAGTTKPPTHLWTVTLGGRGETGDVRYNPVAGITSGRWFARGSVPGAYPPIDTYLGVDGPMDQRAEEQAGLSLVSAPMTRDVTIVGGGRVHLRLTADAPDTDVVVRVVDTYPAGSAFPAGHATIVASGWLRASHRLGHETSKIRPLPVRKAVDLDVELWPTGYRVAKGHRLRIDIASADTPRFMPPLEPVQLTVDLGASRAVLPVIGTAVPLTLTRG